MSDAPNEWTATDRRRERLLLIGVTLAALGLRVWGIEYGFPHPWARPDELRWVRIALGLLEDPDPRWFQWPTLHGYILAALYGLWGKVGVALGHDPSWHAFLNPPEDVYPQDLVLLGRGLSSVTGALTVPATWALAERLGRGTGLPAAVLMAVAFAPVRDAHWALIEPLLLLGIIATLWLTVRAVEQPNTARFAAAGIATGLTMSAKYSGVSLAIGIIVACAAARRAEGRAWIGALWDGRLWLAGILTLVFFFAGSPYMLISRAEFAAAMEIREWSYRDASFGTPPGWIQHAIFSLRYSHGLAGEIAGVAGLLALGFASPGRAAVLAYGVGTYLALGPARIVPMRYASSLAPCVALGASWLLARLAGQGPRRRAVLVAGTLLLAAEPIYHDARFDDLLSREDTRVSARRWLEANIPAGTTIMIRDSKALRWGRPPLEDRWPLVDYAPRLARRRQVPFMLLAESSTGYIPWAPEIREVLSESGRLVAEFDPFEAGAAPVYDPHDAFFVPVAGFSGVRRPGPRVTIWNFPPP